MRIGQCAPELCVYVLFRSPEDACTRAQPRIQALSALISHGITIAVSQTSCTIVYHEDRQNENN
jgi:hypothetical protein